MLNSCVKKLLWVVVVLSVLALPVTGYLTYLHYVPEDGSFCNFNAQFNCDVVNKSEWSTFDLGFVKIPVAIMGMSTYIFFLIVVVMMIKGVNFTKLLGFLSEKVLLWLLFLFSVFGFGFSAYLTYIEAFVLMSYCIYCLMSQGLILLIMLTFGLALLKHKKSGA